MTHRIMMTTGTRRLSLGECTQNSIVPAVLASRNSISPNRSVCRLHSHLFGASVSTVCGVSNPLNSSGSKEGFPFTLPIPNFSDYQARLLNYNSGFGVWGLGFGVWGL